MKASYCQSCNQITNHDEKDGKCLKCKSITTQQMKALHLAFRQLSEELNEAGWDMKKTLKPEISIPWSPRSIKEFLFRPIMKAQTGKTSTTELSSKEITEVWDTLTRHLGEKFGITVMFPSIQELMFKQEK